MYLLYSFVPALFATNAHQGFPSRQSWNCLQEIQRKWPLGHRFIGSYGGAIQHGGGRTWQTSTIITTQGFCKQITWKQQIVTLESVLQTFVVLPENGISRRNTLEVRKSALGFQFIRNEAIQLVGRHHHWKCRTSSIWNKQALDVVELCVFITHDTTVAQNTFQLESSTCTMLQHFASQSAQPLPRVCIAPRVATDRAALKTSNACSHCAAATQAVMTVPKDTRFNCRAAKRAVSWKEIRTMVWKTYWQCYLYVWCAESSHGDLYPCSMLQGTCNLRSPMSDSRTKAFCLRAAWKMKRHLNSKTIVTQHLISSITIIQHGELLTFTIVTTTLWLLFILKLVTTCHDSHIEWSPLQQTSALQPSLSYFGNVQWRCDRKSTQLSLQHRLPCWGVYTEKLGLQIFHIKTS